MNHLRLLLAAALAAFVTLGAHAQDDAISTYFGKYVDDEESTVVYISGKMFDLMESVIKNLDTEDMSGEQVDALTEVVQDMRALRIVSRPGANSIAEYKAARQTLLGAKPYEVLMTVRERGNTFVDFYVRERDGLVDELLLLIGESPEGRVAKALADDEETASLGGDGSFTLLSFEGRIAIDRIGDLARAFEDDAGIDEDED